MKVFMLGWEFPPFISGGLGTACHGLTKAMSKTGIDVVFVLPKPISSSFSTHVTMLSPQQTIAGEGWAGTEYDELKNVQFRAIDSPLAPYSSPEYYKQRLEEIIRQKRLVGSDEICVNDSALVGEEHYSGDMLSEISRYAAAAVRLAQQEQFDVIHAHDWMTYPAGIAVAAVTGKPLVIHVHSTEFDRSGEHVNQAIYDIERRGMHAADKIIAVSHMTRNIILARYGLGDDKVEVVYNGVDRQGNSSLNLDKAGIGSDEKIVLFLGRITMQKGPEYFLMAAKKVLEVMDNVKFVMAGSGDMMGRIIEMAAAMGIGQKVLFTGFLQGNDVRKVFEMADLYVMPSVSEPFGIAPLEALNHDVPVLISKQSGVAEVLTHVLKVDFWDVNEMANKILAVLRYPPLHMTLREHGNFEVRKLIWEDSARKCAEIYGDLTVTV
ncbi:MAG: glycosyltransferase family 4 protein [Planctomycetota bacterium]|jgi:glycosyltransferase involved in cell wall biosynthesis